MQQNIETMKQAQELVRKFAERNGWKDVPNIDKFDHIHEELIELSQHLRYKTEEERIKFVSEHKELFAEEMGDLFFGICRLANQLGVDLEDSFNLVKKKVFEKYNHRGAENNIVSKKSLE